MLTEKIGKILEFIDENVHGDCAYWVYSELHDMVSAIGIPELLTSDETRDKEVLWVEMFDHSTGKYFVRPYLVTDVDKSGIRLADKDGYGHYLFDRDYNNGEATFRWRAWDNKPTDEQMKETEWLKAEDDK